MSNGAFLMSLSIYVNPHSEKKELLSLSSMRFRPNNFQPTCSATSQAEYPLKTDISIEKFYECLIE